MAALFSNDENVKRLVRRGILYVFCMSYLLHVVRELIVHLGASGHLDTLQPRLVIRASAHSKADACNDVIILHGN